MLWGGDCVDQNNEQVCILILDFFFLSGVLHTLGLWGMGRGGEFIKVTGFFMMMAVGILLEYS